MDKDEALRIALEALIDLGWHNENCPQFPTWAEPKKHPPCTCGYDTTITALRQALSQSDDAAWARHLKEPVSEKRVHESDTMERECNPHPDAPHGFNRDASHGLGRYVCDCEGWEPPNVSQEPQTMPEKTDDVAQETQPEQEPVAWLDVDEYEAYSNSELDEEAKKDLTPLYTAPPKREWVGLTETERINLEMLMMGQIQVAGLNAKGISNAIRAVEQVLKERNT